MFSQIFFSSFSYFINDNINKSEIFELIGNIFMEVYKNLKRLAEMNKREINKVYKQWQRSDLDTFKNVFDLQTKVAQARAQAALYSSNILTAPLAGLAIAAASAIAAQSPADRAESPR